jgi:uncharacterized membrane protein YbhN (UPF0104 family)
MEGGQGVGAARSFRLTPMPLALGLPEQSAADSDTFPFFRRGGRLENRMPRALKIVIACVLLVLLFIGVDREIIARQLAALDWRPAAIGLAAVALELLANAWKWRCSLQLHDLRFPWPYLFRTGCFAYFFNNLLPSAIGGDVYRIYRTMTPDV